MITKTKKLFSPTNLLPKRAILALFFSYQWVYTLNKKSWNEWEYSLVTVLQSKVLVQWLNFHSVNKGITCSATEFSLIEQGLLIWSTMTKEYPHSFNNSFFRVYESWESCWTGFQCRFPPLIMCYPALLLSEDSLLSFLGSQWWEVAT